MLDAQGHADFRMLSEAVQAWYRHYDVDPDEPVSAVLCSAALSLYQRGHRSVEAIASGLIGAFIGMPSTRINAPTSASVH